MLAYSLKEILELVPEALPLVKKANLEESFPLDNRDSCIASALQLKYFEKIAYHPVNFLDMEKTAKAVTMYNIGEVIDELTDMMVKAAEAKKINAELNTTENYLLKQASFVGDLPSTPIANLSETATYLYKLASDKQITPAEEVILYSGNGYLNKEAAAKSLTVRHMVTRDETFVKIAKVLEEEHSDERLTKPEALVKLANYINALDQKHNLHFKGFNFYKEVFFIKEAEFKGSVNVKLAGTSVPYESIMRVGKDNISSYLGEDVAKEMDSGPANFKAVLETLPLDMQKLLINLTKNV